MIDTNWNWPHFTQDEMKCHESGDCKMVPEFMDRLEDLRIAFNKPMHINSGYRSPVYNAKVSKTGVDGPHTTGRAVDIAAFGEDAFVLLLLAFKYGFTGIGLSQKNGLAARFIHLDDITSPFRPRIWTY